MIRRAPVLTAAALAALAVTALAGASAAQAEPAAGGAAAHAPGRVIVGFQPDATATQRAAARSAVRATGHAPISPSARNTELLQIGAADVTRAAAALARNPGVRFAEPDWRVTATETSNDPLVTAGNTWGLYGASTTPANPFGSNAMSAWTAGRIGADSVHVGIIDTGIDTAHPDLSGNIWVNPGETAGDGLDNDSNGYVDDVTGWDFHNGDRTVYDPGDGDTHGTHVAGTIGGVGGNGTGVAGVNWNVTMIPAKFLGPQGGYISNAVKAADYLTSLKARHGLNLVATNNSWGGGGFSQAMLDAINRGGDAGILFVVAAGNGGSDGAGDNNDTTANYPSNYQCTTAARTWDCVVAVAAITSSGSRASFSNYGASTVELGAPGQAITSTLPGNTYGSYSGTSMAAPHVTGAVALCRASFPSMGAGITRQTLLATAAPTTSMSGATVSGGRLDAGALAASCAAQQAGGATPTPPAAARPGEFAKASPKDGATGLGTRVSLRWLAASGATSYEACVDTTDDNACSGAWTNVGNATSATASLSGKRTYYWQVRAINAGGTTAGNGGAWWRFTTR